MPRLVRDDYTESWTAAAAYSPGNLVVCPSGRVGIVLNGAAVAIGDTVTACTRGEIEISHDASTKAAGANVYVNLTTQQSVTGTSDTLSGKAVVAGTGKSTIRFLLNE